MAVRPSTIIGHKALHQPTKKVKEVTDEIRTLVADMFDTMEAANGVGLAANQVGARHRIFVFDCPSERGEDDNFVGVVLNPVDHPHGGGEGRTSGGRHPVSPWGKPEGRTRDKNKASSRLIVRRRKTGKKR